MKPQRSMGLYDSPQNLQTILEQNAKVLDGNIQFGTVGSIGNMKGFMAAGVTPGVANTEFTVTHNLGVVPVGYLVMSVDQAAIIYKSTTVWTGTAIFLKCNATNVNYVLFVLV